MRRYILPCLVAALLVSLTDAAPADEKKDAGPLVLKIKANKDKYAWDAGGKTPKEFKKALEEIAEAMKKNPRPAVKLPDPPKVDLVLEIVNDGKEDVTVHVGGDPNVYTLELKGPGVMTFTPPLAFTREFRVPKAVVIAPGKSYDIPVTQLKDGFRGASRFIYWTEPGEYTLTATYQLSDARGEKGALLKSKEIKLKVEEKTGKEKE
jgi:hypothetical protein